MNAPEFILKTRAEAAEAQVALLQRELNALLECRRLRLEIDLTTSHGMAERHITIIKHRVAAEFRIDPDEMNSRVRLKEISFPRQVAMCLSREMTGASLQEIGTNFGQRDHGTVLHSVHAVHNVMATDPRTAHIIHNLSTIIRDDFIAHDAIQAIA